jgi:hypothetical protein
MHPLLSWLWGLPLPVLLVLVTSLLCVYLMTMVLFSVFVTRLQLRQTLSRQKSVGFFHPYW